jgi:hypothetical protein
MDLEALIGAVVAGGVVGVARLNSAGCGLDALDMYEKTTAYYAAASGVGECLAKLIVRAAEMAGLRRWGAASNGHEGC